MDGTIHAPRGERFGDAGDAFERRGDGAAIAAGPGFSICDNLLQNGIEIEHACEKSCACTTCHVVIREGFDTLTPSAEEEDDLLDRAWGLEPASRLSCQTLMPDNDLVIEIPKYTINMVSEGSH